MVHSPDIQGSPPPQYSETADHARQTAKDSIAAAPPAWLVRHTSISVETTSINQDQGSDKASYNGSSGSDPKRQLRNMFKARQDGSKDPRAMVHAMKEPFDTQQLGTQVTIEATRPKAKSSADRRIELKGLQEAASAKRWTGNGSPGEVWGKLMRDPELWDEEGDTLIYYSYSRPDPSFRIKASLLEETKSEDLIDKLRAGHRKEPKRATASLDPRSTAAVSTGMKGLSLSSKKRQPLSEARDESLIHNEIHFPASSQASRLDVLRHHITTRNFLALLKNKPFVGLTFYQALVDLQERCEDLLPTTNSAQLIIRALIRIRLHNVSNDPASAAGLLAWSEDNFWQEGWREAYVHCSGMYNQLRTLPEFSDVSHVTRTLLERSSLEHQAKLQEATDKLSRFHFDDMWPMRKNNDRPIPASFHAFRRFLVRHYEKIYKDWPPRPKQEGGDWLTRPIMLRLQEDFKALYNFYVDADVVWDESNVRIIHKSARTPLGTTLYPGNPDTSLEKIIVDFDQRYQYPHVPHAYPLLPKSVTVGGVALQAQNKPLFGSKTKALEKNIIAASNESSNALSLRPDTTTNSLVEAFIKFDRTDHLGEEDPRTSRQTRWVLLYGVIQTISQMIGVAPQMWFHEDVDYFLNPRLKGMPPWQNERDTFEEAAPAELHRWLRPSWL